MAEPEVVDSSGGLVPGEKNEVFSEEPFEIEGWKKKVTLLPHLVALSPASLFLSLPLSLFFS
jgi:hypothetical protein